VGFGQSTKVNLFGDVELIAVFVVPIIVAFGGDVFDR